MLRISKQTDYALLFLSYLKRKKKLISLSKIVAETHLPKRFLARIASALKKVGMIESFEGKTGGYKLSKKINRFFLYDFLEIFEKNLYLTSCSERAFKCQYENNCHHKNLFKEKLKKIIINNLKKYPLKNVI